MASSSFSSSHPQQSPWLPVSTMLWICQDAAEDSNGAFIQTKDAFETRLNLYREKGLSAVSQVCTLFKQVADFIEQKYPEGVDILGFRMHADEHQLPLSRSSGGGYSLKDDNKDLETMQKIFGNVNKFLMIEGCRTGYGKNGILKHVVGLCPPGVVGIGSKDSVFEVGFDPLLPAYMRFQCLTTDQDITRIYYKTKNGSIQNIPVRELILLWDLFQENSTALEEKQRAFELCYQLLGERNDGVAFSELREKNKEFIDCLVSDFKRIKRLLRNVEVSKSGAKAIWMEMLNELEALKSEMGADESAEVLINQSYRKKKRKEMVVKGGLLVDLGTAYQEVYRFILGCAFIDQYKPLLMLLDDQAGYGSASRAILALSGLTIHGDDTVSLTHILAYHFSVIKKSFRVAKNTYLLKEWFLDISKGVCFNEKIQYIDEFYEEKIRPSKEDRLRIAVFRGDGKEVLQLIKQGVNLHASELDIHSLHQDAVNRNHWFVVFLLVEKLYPDQVSTLIKHIQQVYKTLPGSKEILDRQVQLISEYLADQRDFRRAYQYTKLICSYSFKLQAICGCSEKAASHGKVKLALQQIRAFLKTCPVHVRCASPNRNQLTLTAQKISECALIMDDFRSGLAAAVLIPDEEVQKKCMLAVFLAIEKNDSLDLAIELVQSEEKGQHFLFSYVREEKDLKRALTIAEALCYPGLLTEVRVKIVDGLIKESRLHEALVEAQKVSDISHRNPFIFHVLSLALDQLDGCPWLAMSGDLMAASSSTQLEAKHSEAVALAVSALNAVEGISELPKVLDRVLNPSFHEVDVVKLAQEVVKLQLEDLPNVAQLAGCVVSILDHYLKENLLEFFKALESENLKVDGKGKDYLDHQCQEMCAHFIVRGEGDLALQSARIIRNDRVLFHTLVKCAKVAQSSEQMTQILENVQPLIFVFKNKSRGVPDYFFDSKVKELVAIALRKHFFSQAVKAALWSPNPRIEEKLVNEIFDVMVEERPLKQVIALFSRHQLGIECLNEYAVELKCNGQFKDALMIVEATNDEYLLPMLLVKTVEALLKESQLDEAYAQAMKMLNERERDRALFPMVSCALDGGFPYLALDVARSIVATEKKEQALKLVALALLDQNQPHFAFKVMQEINSPFTLAFLAENLLRVSQFHFVLKIGQRIDRVSLRDAAYLGIARDLLNQGKLLEAFSQVADVVNSGERAPVLFDIVHRALRGQDLQLAKQVALSMEPDQSFAAMAFLLIAGFLTKMGDFEDAAHVALNMFHHEAGNSSRNIFINTEYVLEFLPVLKEVCPTSDTSLTMINKERVIEMILRYLINQGQEEKAIACAEQLPERIKDDWGFSTTSDEDSSDDDFYVGYGDSATSGEDKKVDLHLWEPRKDMLIALIASRAMDGKFEEALALVKRCSSEADRAFVFKKVVYYYALFLVEQGLLDEMDALITQHGPLIDEDRIHLDKRVRNEDSELLSETIFGSFEDLSLDSFEDFSLDSGEDL